MTNYLLKNLTAVLVIVLTIGMSVACAQDIQYIKNPKDLPSCPALDYSKKKDIGIDGRTEKWDNCFGKLKYEIGSNDTYEGEFKNGMPEGMGIYMYSQDFKGHKHVGNFIGGVKYGKGIWIRGFDDGGLIIGIWKNDLLVQIIKQTNIVDYVKSSDYKRFEQELEDERLIYADERKKIDDEKSNRSKGNIRNYPICEGQDVSKWHYCWGKEQYSNGDLYEGEWRYGLRNGQGKNILASGVIQSGNWEGDKFIIDSKINLENNAKSLKYVWPTNGSIIKNFNDNKKGIHIAGQEGQAILTIANGTVLYAGYMRGYGKLIIVNHADDVVSAYAHNKTLLVKEGQSVTKGQQIAEMGNTDSDNIKLNFEIRQYGNPIDPLVLLDASYINAEQNTKKGNINPKKIVESKNIEQERQQLAEERRKFEEEKRSREQARNNQRVNLQVTNTQANAEGDFVINIQTGTDTASLKINGEEQGGRADGNYTIKKVARAGQETKFTIIAKDINGNTDSKTIAVVRQVAASSQVKYAELNPALVKTQPNKDAVAIIIGIADYKNLPRADYANDDARAFYDYAIRGLGVKAENIKLLVDADAGQEEIYKAFKTWLPARVRATTDVYVYYSGHGITTNDGQSLYLLPQRTDRDLIEETAIAQNKINAALQAAKPKSVTIFLDSCYSGAGRTGQTLLASARPISIKSTAQAFPSEFTVISASTAEQISSSSNELKHGIFSYYLMRGMEGDADTNKDGKITAGEMHTYLTENVARQASLVNRVQQPQLSGDANRVLIGK